jgi:outer membrane protein assembly factor BamE (lipoprotein component of BamABCDE complex)
MRRCIWFILLLFPLLNGCVIIPTPEHGAGVTGGRGQIPQKTLDLIKPGVTTREDVLLLLGEPDIVDENETTFAYCWSVVEGYLFWGVGAAGGGVAPGAAGGGPIPKMYGVTIKFDRQGVVQLCSTKYTEFFDAFFGPEYKLYESMGVLNPPPPVNKTSKLTPDLVILKVPELNNEPPLAYVKVNDMRPPGAAAGKVKPFAMFDSNLGEMVIVLHPPEKEFVAVFLEVELTRLLRDKDIRTQQDFDCDMEEFAVNSDSSLFHSIVNCRVRLVLKYNGNQYNLSGAYTDRSFFWPPNINKVVEESFKQIAAELKRTF